MYNPIKPYKKEIAELIKQTWETPWVTVQEYVYPVITKKFSYPEIDHSDGIGTKGVYHWEHQTFRSAVLDALAMNLNDLAVIGATPYKIQDHIFVPEEDERIVKIVTILVSECKKRNIAVTGGEISYQDTMQGMDISITMSGFLKTIHKNRFNVGDLLIGIKSNGLHSNGFTKVRQAFGKEWREEFTDQTAIYWDTIMDLTEHYEIHGMAHITGGAFTKLQNSLESEDIQIKRDHMLHPQPIFHELYKKGIPDKEMYETFNCGIGFVISTSPKDAEDIIAKLPETDIIGKVTPGEGKVKIESAFSDKEIEF